GNAYSDKQSDSGGRVIALWPLHPDRVKFRRAAPQAPLQYEIRLPQTEQLILLPAERVLHQRGLSSNGVTGLSPITVAREAIGMAVAAQEFGARLFSNGVRPSGVFEHPNKLSTVAHTRLATSLQQEHAGLENKHRTLILEEGMKWQQIAMNPDDAQFLESRKFSVVEVARMFNIPPHFLRDLERATFSNIEQQAIEFVVYSLRPWLVRWEQRIAVDLIPPDQRASYYCKFSVDGLLRGDIKSRNDAYQV